MAASVFKNLFTVEEDLKVDDIVDCRARTRFPEGRVAAGVWQRRAGGALTQSPAKTPREGPGPLGARRRQGGTPEGSRARRPAGDLPRTVRVGQSGARLVPLPLRAPRERARGHDDGAGTRAVAQRLLPRGRDRGRSAEVAARPRRELHRGGTGGGGGGEGAGGVHRFLPATGIRRVGVGRRRAGRPVVGRREGVRAVHRNPPVVIAGSAEAQNEPVH